MSKRLRNTVIVVGLITVLSLAALILWPLWPYLGSPSVAEQIRELKKQGKPVCAKDLIPPRIPDSENAAVLYEQAFKAVPLTKRQLAVVAETLKHTRDQHKPTDWRQVKPLIAKCDSALAIAAQAVRLPKCAFPVKWQDAHLAEFPHLGKVRDLGRLLAARAIISAREGRMASAVRDIETGFAVSQALSGEPSIISMLVQVTMIGIAESALRDCLARGHVEDAQARRLYDQLGRFDLRASHIRALEGERAQLLTVCEWLRRGDFDKLGAEPAGPGDSSGKPGLGTPRVFTQIFGRANEWWVLKVMRENIRNSRLSYRELRTRRIPEPDENVPKYAVLAAVGSPLCKDTARSRDMGIAAVSGTRITLALEAYYDRFRAYPQTLDELGAKLGWKIEKDPFSGKDYVYKKLPRSYLLYSYGTNLKDDGGKPWEYFKRLERAARKKTRAAAVKPGKPREPWDEPGDIVWRIER